MSQRSMVEGLEPYKNLQLFDNWSVWATPKWYVISRHGRCKQIISRDFFDMAMLSFVVTPNLGLDIRMMGQPIMLLRGY